MLKIARHLTRRERVRVLFIFLLAVTQIRLDLMIPEYMRVITVTAQTPGSQLSEVITSGGIMLLSAALSLACVFTISFLASRTSAALAMRLREKVFSKVGDFSMEEFSRFSTSSLIARSTNDITQIQQFIMAALQMLLKIPILAIGGFVGIINTGIQWFVAALIAFVFVIIVVTCTMASVMPLFKKMQELVDRLNLTARERLAGRLVVRAYNAEAFHEQKFETANDGFTRVDRSTNRAMAIMSPVMSLGTNGVLIAVYVIGAFLINSAGQAEGLQVFSGMVVMTFYLGMLFNAVKFVTKVVPRIPRATVSAKRIIEVLETKPAVTYGMLGDVNTGVKGEVTFKNVSFRYPGAGADALGGVSFTAKPGETIAIIGSTGSGKSTLLNLVMRFFDATAGEVLVNGVNIKEYSQKTLNNKIGYVPQKSVLMKGTLFSNVAYGENERGYFSAADVENAVRIAQAEEFVGKLKEGLNAPVFQRGSNFSGGQKQRISIARALCREPEILIFDDSFSGLDYKTDRALRDALKTELSNTTKLIVSQRIAAAMDADAIIVLDDGSIVGMGCHSELLESCDVYRAIAKTQLSEEEMAS
ncbi:MAG: ABC transporter ATP-binding protein/permease [Oscillospiraceae bacterium]|nr:ABC transporter ATP-binding protein/permease [Oscillospiraceae bacterium]